MFIQEMICQWRLAIKEFIIWPHMLRRRWRWWIVCIYIVRTFRVITGPNLLKKRLSLCQQPADAVFKWVSKLSTLFNNAIWADNVTNHTSALPSSTALPCLDILKHSHTQGDWASSHPQVGLSPYPSLSWRPGQSQAKCFFSSLQARGQHPLRQWGRVSAQCLGYLMLIFGSVSSWIDSKGKKNWE